MRLLIRREEIKVFIVDRYILKINMEVRIKQLALCRDSEDRVFGLNSGQHDIVVDVDLKHGAQVKTKCYTGI